MAKVGKKEFRIGTEHPVSYPLFYTQKYGFEIRGIDEEFFNLTGVSNAGYNTEAELTEAIYKAIPKYHEFKKSERLVIAYRCKATTSLTMNSVSEGSYSGTIEGVSRKIKGFDAFTAPDCAIGIDYKIFMEVFNGKSNEYFPVDEDHKVSSVNNIHWTVLDGMTFIEYTKDNLEFFENIKKGMQELVKKMSLFFDLDSEGAQLLIQQNTKLIG